MSQTIHDGFQVKWEFHHDTIVKNIAKQFKDGVGLDVTLSCESQSVKAHKTVLAASSPYFRNVLTRHAEAAHPVIVIHRARFKDLRKIVEFMYSGEVNVPEEEFARFMETARDLQIQGLSSINLVMGSRSEYDMQNQVPIIVNTSEREMEMTNRDDNLTDCSIGTEMSTSNSSENSPSVSPISSRPLRFLKDDVGDKDKMTNPLRLRP